MTIDIHCHFVPRPVLDRALARPDGLVRLLRDEGDTVDLEINGRFFGLNPVFFDTRRQLARMDELGVQMSVLSLATPFVFYGGPDEAEDARLCNDGLANAVAADRARFAAWAFLPMSDPEAAAAELRRCVAEHGFVGGHIATNVNGRYPDHESYRPVFEAATELGVPLFMHPATPLGREHMRDFELTTVAGYLFDSTIAILKLICSGTLDRHPDLKLVCAHTGAFSLPMRARMQREVDTNPDLAARLTGPVESYLRRLWFESVCFEPAMLRYAVSVVGADRIMLGSDGPFPLGEADPVGFVNNALPDEADRRKLFRDNASRLLGSVGARA